MKKMAEAVMVCDVVKTTHYDGDKDQMDTSYAGLSVGGKDDELPTAIITVKGMYIDIILLVVIGN
jgi:hypothetical protein